jgi:hypothetical protein
MSVISDEESFYNDIRYMFTRQFDEEISNKVIKKLRKNVKKLTQQNSNVHDYKIKKIISKKKNL